MCVGPKKVSQLQQAGLTKRSFKKVGKTKYIETVKIETMLNCVHLPLVVAVNTLSTRLSKTLIEIIKDIKSVGAYVMCLSISTYMTCNSHESCVNKYIEASL